MCTPPRSSPKKIVLLLFRLCALFFFGQDRALYTHRVAPELRMAQKIKPAHTLHLDARGEGFRINERKTCRPPVGALMARVSYRCKGTRLPVKIVMPLLQGRGSRLFTTARAVFRRRLAAGYRLLLIYSQDADTREKRSGAKSRRRATWRSVVDEWMDGW